MFFKKNYEGGSFMVWGALCAEGCSEISILHGKKDSEKYFKKLVAYLIRFIREKPDSDTFL